MVRVLCDVIFGIVEGIGGGFGCNRGGTCFGNISRVLCKGLSSYMYILRSRNLKSDADTLENVSAGLKEYLDLKGGLRTRRPILQLT
jgi:hypothetical protein